MSSLATKYRPSKLEDIVGQDIVKKVLIKQVEQTRFRNAYGFFGASGCGKKSKPKHGMPCLFMGTMTNRLIPIPLFARRIRFIASFIRVNT